MTFSLSFPFFHERHRNLFHPYFAPISAQDIVQDQRAIVLRDRHGLSLGTLLTRDQDHTAVVPLEQISDNFIQAIFFLIEVNNIF